MIPEILRSTVRGAYDIQNLRIQTGNRIVANFKARLGQKPGEKEEDIGAKEQTVLNTLRKEYDRITDGLVQTKDGISAAKFKNFHKSEIISSYTELCLVAQYIDTLENEAKHFRRLKGVLEEIPIYNEFLIDVVGIGPAMAGVLLSEIDITKATYPSSLWKYAGLDVITITDDDGTTHTEGRSRKKAHLVKREYIAKDGTVKEKDSITFSPFLKTKLIGVLGPSFLRSRGEYAEVYNNYKHRLENSPAHMEKSKLHRHNMAVRYMVKRFLVDLYTEWRALEGLPVSDEYSKAKLGITHKTGTNNV